MGVCGVGTIVLAACTALALGLPSRLPADDLAALSGVLALYIALSGPFDLFGGYLLPCGHGRMCRTFPAFLWSWVRGVTVHAVCLGLCGLAVLSAGRVGGFAGAAGAVLLLMLVLLAAQSPLAKLVGGLRSAPAELEPAATILGQWRLRPPANVAILAGIDAGFVGGLAGLPGFERLVVPGLWAGHLGAESIAVQIARRAVALATGARRRGVLLALLWNLAGFSLAYLMPGAGVNTVAGLVTLSLWFTLWSFLGLLTLPSLSRPGVFEVDREAAAAGAPPELVERAAAELDQLQDDEPHRPKGIETIFHPIPSVTSRVERLRAGGRPRGCWQGARMALFLSWASLGFLSRAVHCNAGRPELWVLFPGD